MSTGTSITFFLSFQGFECLLSKFFIADKKGNGFPVMSSVSELCSNRCSCSLFKSLHFNFLCLQQKYIIKQEEIFRNKK